MTWNSTTTRSSPSPDHCRPERTATPVPRDERGRRSPGLHLRLEPLTIDGAHLVALDRIEDDRGWFARAFCADTFLAEGLVPPVAQTNLSDNLRAGTIRGLHYQLPPSEEAKLARCVAGAVFDVVLDLRRDSPTFGRWDGRVLTADAGDALYVPPGCAHGYQALEDGARLLYQVSVGWDRERERGVDALDPALAIAWPLPPGPRSPRDAGLPPLAGADLPPRRCDAGGEDA